MVKRTVNTKDDEPDQGSFEKPSQKEHLFRIVDFIYSPDPIIMLTKMEVVGGEEEGRSLLKRLTLDDSDSAFFATRMLLKAIGEPYKGSIEIDTDRWIGKQFYAEVVHNESKGKKYANISFYNYDKMVEKSAIKSDTTTPTDKNEQIAWDE